MDSCAFCDTNEYSIWMSWFFSKANSALGSSSRKILMMAFFVVILFLVMDILGNCMSSCVVRSSVVLIYLDYEFI